MRFDKIAPIAHERPEARAKQVLRKLLLVFNGSKINTMPKKHIRTAIHCEVVSFSCNKGHAMMATHIGIVKVRIAVLLAPPSTKAHIRNPVNPAVWNKPRVNNFADALVAIGLRKSIKITNSTTAPKKLRKNANVAGLENSNAAFIKGIFKPHTTESNKSPPMAMIFFLGIGLSIDQTVIFFKDILIESQQAFISHQ